MLKTTLKAQEIDTEQIRAVSCQVVFLSNPYDVNNAKFVIIYTRHDANFTS